MSCSFKSVTLIAGEQFVLPPGAEIVSASDPTAISSTHDCAGDLTKLEVPQCYVVGMGQADGSGNNISDGWAYGISIDNIQYPFSYSVNFGSDTAGVGNQISAGPFGAIIEVRTCGTTNHLYQYYYGPSIFVCVKTIPSIAATLKVYGLYSIANTGRGTGYTNAPVEWDFIPLADMKASSGNPGMFDCFNC